MIISPQQRAAVLALLVATAAAFVPSTPSNFLTKPVSTRSVPAALGGALLEDRSSAIRQNHNKRSFSLSPLHLAAEDFNEGKYTEAAWSTIASLTKVGDYYQASTLVAPFLLETMLSPGRHNAGDDAESARKVVEKTLQSAGVDVKKLRQDLETYLAKLPKLTSGSTQKVMGPYLQKVLETSRTTMKILGDSFVSTEGMLLALVKEDAQFTRDALLKQGVKYTMSWMW